MGNRSFRTHGLRRHLVQQVDSLTQTVRDESGRELACQTQRAAAAPLSSGRVLKAMAAWGAARWMALTTASNRASRLGGRRRPAPIYYTVVDVTGQAAFNRRDRSLVG